VINNLSKKGWSLRLWFWRSWLGQKKNVFFLRLARLNSSRRVDRQPLVSVLIPTYNRARLLSERAVPSILKQTYQNFEIVIVGDHCTDDTAKSLAKIHDVRIKFYNLPQRGKYPVDPNKRWCVAGAVPANKCLKLAKGEWIASLDDDDEFSPDHLEVLVEHAKAHGLEMVYGVVQLEVEPGKWSNLGAHPLKWGNISRMATLYSSQLKFFKYDTQAWKNAEPADWNLWRRMQQAGVRIGFVNAIVGKHYLEKQQLGK
jgi:glycosyltransferase involved in cell wall biosynthesis